MRARAYAVANPVRSHGCRFCAWCRPAELLSEFVFVEVSPLSPTFFAVVLATRAKDCVSFLGLHRDSFDYIRRHISYWRNGGKPTPSKVERLEMKRRRAEVGYRRWRRAERE